MYHSWLQHDLDEERASAKPHTRRARPVHVPLRIANVSERGTCFRARSWLPDLIEEIFTSETNQSATPVQFRRYRLASVATQFFVAPSFVFAIVYPSTSTPNVHLKAKPWLNQSRQQRRVNLSPALLPSLRPGKRHPPPSTRPLIPLFLRSTRLSTRLWRIWSARSRRAARMDRMQMYRELSGGRAMRTWTRTGGRSSTA